ncbi:NTM1-like 8 [Perilla frutescens var. frutescens]|nr:NTM1-like 8 [Perilla frutescens var. frutescens]
MEISIAEASSMFPGFRFSPTDEELIQYYLKKKLQGSDDTVEVIPEVDICRHEPWDLPGESVIQSDSEWFFFSPRGRKYPNGSQSRRATASGYWKATGKERSVRSGSTLIGTKRTLVFHMGRAPKGQRTEWIMHEYTTSDKSEDTMVVCRLRKNREFHLNEEALGERELLGVDKSRAVLSGVEQCSMPEGAKTEDCSSSRNSHSGDQQVQVVTGSETNESSLNEGDADAVEDDDCYADIMEDNIIELDDASMIRALPFQGTANRRLRLRSQRMESHFIGLEQRQHSLIHKVPTTTVFLLAAAMLISLFLLSLLTPD